MALQMPPPRAKKKKKAKKKLADEDIKRVGDLPRMSHAYFNVKSKNKFKNLVLCLYDGVTEVYKTEVTSGTEFPNFLVKNSLLNWNDSKRKFRCVVKTEGKEVILIP